LPRNKCHYVLIKGTIHQEHTMIINSYALNVVIPNFIKQTLSNIKRQIGPDIVTIGDSNNPLSIHTSSTQNTNKEILELNCTIMQMYLADIQ
jgi:hypothetical protein